MTINYGDLECSPWAIGRQEAAADARLNALEQSDGCDVCGGFFGHRLNCEILEAAMKDKDQARESEIWAAEMRELED